MKIPASHASRELSFLSGNAPLVPSAEKPSDPYELVIRTQFVLDGSVLDNISTATTADPAVWSAIAAALADLGETVGKSRDFEADLQARRLVGYGKAKVSVLDVQASAQLIRKVAAL